MSVRVQVLLGGEPFEASVRAGESWLATATRCAAAAGEGRHPSEPLDMSGRVKRFVVDPDVRVAIRPMARGDLPDVAR